MEKRTVLAVVLSIVVITGFYFVQYKFFPPKNNVIQQNPAPIEQVTETNVPQAINSVPTPLGGEAPVTTPGGIPALSESAAEDFPQVEQHIIIETPLIIADLTNSGGDLVSFKLKEHEEGNNLVDMILAGTNEPHALNLAFGNRNAKPLTSYFKVNRISDYSVEFYRDFSVSGGIFRLTKRYNFKPAEYMFELIVTLDGGYSVPSLGFSSGGFDSAAYTLAFGPQIGPPFEQLDERYDYRHYLTFLNGKQKQEKVTEKQDIVIKTHLSWAAIVGKYFAFIAIPDATQYEYVFSAKNDEPGLSASSRLYIVRPPLSGSRTQDTFRFYLGPKTQKTLAVYDNGANDYGYTDLRLESVSNASGFWGILNPLERLLKWFLTIFYKLIPNYGVAIILVTLLVKLLLFPLTKKSSEGTIRMQAMAPKIKELQVKYKDNPQKMNMEMAAFYKKEGYSPLSGCLPMLIQIPIFLAMYNLFNNHFDLRGAGFIPVWIPDLSQPETIWNFAPTRIPILGWSDLRLLPFIYVGSQFLYAKVTQTPDQSGNAQMKMMMYAMPVLFFFILYNVPSGLLIYWIMSNVLTMIQQLVINRMMAKKRAAVTVIEPEKKVIVPPKKRRKK